MHCRMCNSPDGDDSQALANLTGPAHSHAPANIDDEEMEGDGRWKPCNVRVEDPDGPTPTCTDKIDLPLQLLLVCRQIHNEAALVPFAENCFYFDDEDTGIHTHSFLRSLRSRQRCAIHTAAVFNAQSSTVCHISALVGSERLCASEIRRGLGEHLCALCVVSIGSGTIEEATCQRDAALALRASPRPWCLYHRLRYARTSCVPVRYYDCCACISSLFVPLPSRLGESKSLLAIETVSRVADRWRRQHLLRDAS